MEMRLLLYVMAVMNGVGIPVAGELLVQKVATKPSRTDLDQHSPAARQDMHEIPRLGWRGPFLDPLDMASFPAHRGRDVISNCARVINDFISPCLPTT